MTATQKCKYLCKSLNYHHEIKNGLILTLLSVSIGWCETLVLMSYVVKYHNVLYPTHSLLVGAEFIGKTDCSGAQEAGHPLIFAVSTTQTQFLKNYAPSKPVHGGKRLGTPAQNNGVKN